MCGNISRSFDGREKVTHFVTSHQRTSEASNEILRARNVSGCIIVSSVWLKRCIKDKTRYPEKEYIIPQSKVLQPKNPKALEVQSKEVEVSKTRTPSFSTAHPFILEDIEVPNEVEDATESFKPLTISPVPKDKTGKIIHRAPSVDLARTPKKIMKSPAKPTATSMTRSISGTLSNSGQESLSAENQQSFRNNLSEIIRISKKAEKNSGVVHKRPTRKLQGRILSTESMNSNPATGGFMLSRTNSVRSNMSIDDDATNSNNNNINNNNLNVESNLNSISRSLGASATGSMNFGDSILFDSNEPLLGSGSRPRDIDETILPSQAVHYVDTDAQAEKKKLFEKLMIEDDSTDAAMKGRRVLRSTVAAEQLGAPSKRAMRRVGV